MPQCKSKTKKSGYKRRCTQWALPGEEFCFFHSKSERARQIRSRPKKRRGFDRENLLKELVKDYKNLDDTKAKPIIKIRLRATLSGQILELLRDLNKLDELERLVKEKLE